MNPQHHPSLELQIKLKEIGFNNCETVTDTCGNYIRHTPGFDTGEYNPCPNVMEMLDVIPRVHPEDEGIYHFIQRCYQGQNIFETGYVPNYQGADNICEFYGTLPNVLAEMIIWLVENKPLSQQDLKPLYELMKSISDNK